MFTTILFWAFIVAVVLWCVIEVRYEIQGKGPFTGPYFRSIGKKNAER